MIASIPNRISFEVAAPIELPIEQVQPIVEDIPPQEADAPETFPTIVKRAEAKELKPSEYRNAIADFGARVGVSIEKLEAIMLAESGGNPLAKNPSSSAAGSFQIVRGTWQYYSCVGDRFDFYDNLNCAIKIIKTDEANGKDGFKHWSASEKIWGVVER